MSLGQKVGDLEIDQNLPFQKKMWVIQRIGWSICTLIILAALIGLFGSGPISTGKGGDQDSTLWFEYARLTRVMRPIELQINLGSDAVQNGQIEIWLDRSYLKRIQIEEIVPEPESTEVQSDRILYMFQANNTGDSMTVTFRYRISQAGLLSGEIGIKDGPSHSFKQVVYP